MMKNYVLVAVLFISLLHSSVGLKCYECNPCWDLDAEEKNVTCSGSQVCHKTTTLGESRIVTRGCADRTSLDEEDFEMGECIVDTKTNLTVTSCFCDTELCNAAMSSTTVPVLMVALAAVLSFFC